MLGSPDDGRAHRDREEEWVSLPLFNRSDSFTGTVLYQNLKFENFKTPTTTCGSSQAALGPYWQQTDYVPFIKLQTPTFVNLELDALAHFPKPQDSWANSYDCGRLFPCTALLNVVARVEGG